MDIKTTKSPLEFVQDLQTETDNWIDENLEKYGFVSDYSIWKHFFHEVLGLETIGRENQIFLEMLKLQNSGYIRKENGELIHVVKVEHVSVTYTYEPIEEEQP